jgi:hypothetical protein
MAPVTAARGTLTAGRRGPPRSSRTLVSRDPRTAVEEFAAIRGKLDRLQRQVQEDVEEKRTRFEMSREASKIRMGMLVV